MWNKIQVFVNDLSDKINGEVGIIDTESRVVVSTNKQNIGKIIKKNFDMPEQNIVFRAINSTRVDSEQVYFIGKISEDRVLCEIVHSSIKNMYAMFADKFVKDKFIKEVLTDRVEEDDIDLKCREFKIQEEVQRIVFLLYIPDKSEETVLHIVKQIFPNANKDFVVKLSSQYIVILKEIKREDTIEKIEEIANSVQATISAEAMQSVVIGIGSTVRTFKELAKSYRDASTAINIGMVFEKGNVFSFYKLGLGRLIYHLPVEFCNLFMREVLNGNGMELFDEETLHTIIKFFENNLNISETSRKLYIHRNTLIYRLDKIQKQIDLDLRNFDDALLFQIAILVNKYVRHVSRINQGREHDDRV